MRRCSGRGRSFRARICDRARAAFVARKSEAVRVLDAAALDPEGRRIAREYIEAFFKAIESDSAFYRPVVVSAGTQAYAGVDRQPVCSAGATVPVGTPVSDPIRTEGSLVQVMLLDALWHGRRRRAATAFTAPCG